jgi:hypothetical protein
LTTADADGICAAQTAAAAADLTIGGALYKASTVAYLGTDSAVRITSAGDDTGITFTIYGTNAFGKYEETVTGASGSYVDTVGTFRTVERIIASGASAGNVSAGTSEDTDSLTTAASVAAVGQLSRNGVAYRVAYMYGTSLLAPAQAVYVTSAGDDSGVTFTVYGRDADGVEVSEAITGANAGASYGTTLFGEVIAVYASGAVDSAAYVGISGDRDYICESQALAGAGYFVFNGTGCGLTARHLSITSAGSDESDKTFTIRGLDRRGKYMTETITGPTASVTVPGTKNFSVVHSVRCSAALAGNVTVGSADEAESAFIAVNYYSSSLTYQVRRSSDMDASTEQRMSFTQEEVLLPGSKSEYQVRYNYPYTGWLNEDENQSISGPITGLRLEARSYTIGTWDITILVPFWS